MQRLFTMLVLLNFSAPVIAGASASLDEWRYDELRDDLRLSEILDHDVQSMTDRSLGQVRDIIIVADGGIEAVVVEFQQGIGNSGVAVGVFEWSDAVVEPAHDAITVSIGSHNEPGQPFDVGGVPASEIIGRRVVLADDSEFGQVVDMFIDLERESASALLIEADGKQYALPLQRASLEQDAKLVRYAFDRQLAMQRGSQAVSALQSTNQ